MRPVADQSSLFADLPELREHSEHSQRHHGGVEIIESPTLLALIEVAEAVRDAASPLGRLKLSHSAACPLMFDGTCACGVKELEHLAALAKQRIEPQPLAGTDEAKDRSVV
jgi:hypothetical protein